MLLRTNMGFAVQVSTTTGRIPEENLTDEFANTKSPVYIHSHCMKEQYILKSGGYLHAHTAHRSQLRDCRAGRTAIQQTDDNPHRRNLRRPVHRSARSSASHRAPLCRLN